MWCNFYTSNIITGILRYKRARAYVGKGMAEGTGLWRGCIREQDRDRVVAQLRIE